MFIETINRLKYKGFSLPAGMLQTRQWRIGDQPQRAGFRPTRGGIRKTAKWSATTTSA